MERAHAARQGAVEQGAQRYRRHRPERTVLYRTIERHYPAFVAHLADNGKQLPVHVQRAFENYLQCGRLEHGFLRLRCEECHAEHLLPFSCKRRGFCPSCGARRMAESAALLVDAVLPHRPIRQWVLSFPYPLRFLFVTHPAVLGQVLGIVYRVIATHLVRQAGQTHRTARTGAVTLIQRFGSALNLNIHFHMLFLDGVYVEGRPGAPPRFQWVREPTFPQLTRLAHTIAVRVGRCLQRHGLLEAEHDDLIDAAWEDDPMPSLLGHAITYRIAVGPHQGRKVRMLQTLPADDFAVPGADGPGRVAGFSLHAGVAAKADRRDKLERLCRYVSRPAVSEERLSQLPNGHLRYRLKTPYRNGTTHVIFEPLDFIARLAALVPPPRVNLTRYHGVFAPNSRDRGRITPARRGKGAPPPPPAEQTPERTPAERRAAMSWAQRLKRVFKLDVETCPGCGGTVKLIACIEAPSVIARILAHLEAQEPGTRGLFPESRAPPAGGVG